MQDLTYRQDDHAENDLSSYSGNLLCGQSGATSPHSSYVMRFQMVKMKLRYPVTSKDKIQRGTRVLQKC